jgi:hypothetical protein
MCLTFDVAAGGPASGVAWRAFARKAFARRASASPGPFSCECLDSVGSVPLSHAFVSPVPTCSHLFSPVLTCSHLFSPAQPFAGRQTSRSSRSGRGETDLRARSRCLSPSQRRRLPSPRDPRPTGRSRWAGPGGEVMHAASGLTHLTRDRMPSCADGAKSAAATTMMVASMMPSTMVSTAPGHFLCE